MKDTALVISLLRKRAEQGDAEAQLRLGAMYKKGNMMVAQDDKQAAHWLRKAAEQGRAEASSYSGRCTNTARGGARPQQARTGPVKQPSRDMQTPSGI
ncbi:sel1 repeat family protein [Aeromonas hydrophila]|nr:sel1 repeat family protein [Aeromonas hydrophila]